MRKPDTETEEQARSRSTPGANTTVLWIAGMRAVSCRDHVAAAIGAVEGVRSVHVDLWRAQATIVHESPCGPAQLIRALLRAGYGASLTPSDLSYGQAPDGNAAAGGEPD